MGNPLPPVTVVPALAVGSPPVNAVRLIPAKDSVIAGTTYTFVLADDGLWKRCTNASAVALTIPPHSDVALPLNSTIIVSQDGAGAVTIVAGAGVTLNAAGGKVATAAQYGVCQLFQNTLNVWTLFGNLA